MYFDFVRMRSALLLTCLLSCSLAFAQDSLRVSVLAHVQKDMIRLRWAVNTPLAWKQTNKDGFRIERVTVVRNNQVLAQPEKIILTPVPLKPQPLDNWKDLATTNNYAAVIAQALYGTDFKLSGDDAKGVSRFMALAQELEQRYMVSMYAADLCYPAALLAGWGYEDRSVKAGERYLYRIVPVTAAQSGRPLRIAEGTVYKSLAEYEELPQPQELTAVFADKSVMLTWNYSALDKIYNAYFIEKSSDGKSFRRLSDLPVMNMNSKKGKSSGRMFHIDSLAQNAVPAYYRVIGVTAFSEEGPPSDVVSGAGTTKLVYVPHISRAVPDAQGNVLITWEFDERGNTQIRGFELHRSDNAKGPFVPVVKNIAPAQRELIFDRLSSSNYFMISAIPKDGAATVSFPVLVQPTDTIPPAIPTGLKGTIDSSGIVKLTWTPNTDKDIYGYRLYRAQTSGEELIPLNNDAVLMNQFVDTIEVRNLNSQICYAVTALDRRYNQSGKSAVVTLQKPELVPPSSPVIMNYKVTAKGILLEWETGHEDNLMSLNIYRKEKGTAENTLVHSFQDLSVRTFTDSTVLADKLYGYTLTSVTRGGLSSAPSPVVTVQAPAKTVQTSGVTAFTAKVSKRTGKIELSWKHSMKEVRQLELYKAESGKSLTLWKVLKGFEDKAEDDNVQQGLRYDYMIRFVLVNGKTGAVARATSKN
jgi:hypothetical protein